MGVGMREGLRHSRLEDVAATYERSLAEAAGGGVFAEARLELQNSIVAGNFSTEFASDIHAVVSTSFRYSLIGDNQGFAFL